jgi:hypothetical protein
MRWSQGWGVKGRGDSRRFGGGEGEWREGERKSQLGPTANTSRQSRRTLVQRIIGVGLEEEVLKSDHDGVQVEDGLPVFTQDVEADVALEVEVGVVDLRLRGSGKGKSAWKEVSLASSVEPV